MKRALARLIPPRTIRRDTLQITLLILWILGGLSCFCLIHFSRKALTDARLEIDPLQLLQQSNLTLAGKIDHARSIDHWKDMHRFLAERAVGYVFDHWEIDLDAFRAQLPVGDQAAVNAFVGENNRQPDWIGIADIIMGKKYKRILGDAEKQDDWMLIITCLLPDKALETAREDRIAIILSDCECSLYTLIFPWIAIMVSVLLQPKETRKQYIHLRSSMIAVGFSLLFLSGLIWSFWSRLYLTSEPTFKLIKDGQLDLLSPMIAGLAALIGTIVTFSFPGSERTDRLPVLPAPPNSPPVAEGEG
jgi:hypothetical protein